MHWCIGGWHALVHWWVACTGALVGGMPWCIGGWHALVHWWVACTGALVGGMHWCIGVVQPSLEAATAADHLFLIDQINKLN